MRVSCPLAPAVVVLATLVSLFTSSASCARADTAPATRPSTRPTTYFDPARHMRVADVKVGMKGYGLSVFKGTAIEPFSVEVVSVLHNFNPKYDVILVRCSGANLEHTGSIAGMSGSPIYLKDDAGQVRMCGAFAYGWPLMKDPVGGVQPIEYMLEMPERSPDEPIPRVEANAGDSGAGSDPSRPQRRTSWSITDTIAMPGAVQPPPARFPFASWNSFVPNPRLAVEGDDTTTRLRPLATPLMTSGLSSALLEQLGPALAAHNLVPLQAGGSANADDTGAAADVKLEPGSALAVPLLTGDVDLTAVGTCTEVLDGRVFGFGHAFNGEGPVNLPMGTGHIHAVIANLVTSFKLGSLRHVQGTLNTDQLVGIAGRLGEAPSMVPIDVRVIYADGTLDRAYHFDAALHPRFTPILGAVALASALGGAKELPQYHTVDYDLSMEFSNGQQLRVDNRAVNVGPGDLFYAVGTPMMLAAENPFERVMVKRIGGTITVTPEAREASILSVNAPRLKFRPGETLKAYLAYRPFRDDEAILPVEMELPRDLPEGQYQLVISDWQRFLSDEQQARPFRFSAENVDEVFDVMRDLVDVRQDAVYLRLLRQPDGVAVGRAAMPHLPSSRRQVLLGSGRSDTTAFVSSAMKTLATPLVMSGAAEFVVTIDKQARVEVGGAAPGAPAATQSKD
ncbi:MAG: hypothetical protein ACREIT_01360 [Tepidisphaeraceae bacterium]